MNSLNHPSLILSLDAETRFLPVVMQFVETSATAFGMGKENSLQLCLASEEIYLYLCERICPGRPLEIECLNGIYYTRIYFRFEVSEMNMSGLNITSTIGHDYEADLSEMGLLIAARSVDSLNIHSEKRNHVSLIVTKEKAYPPVEEPASLPADTKVHSIEKPDGEDVKRFALRVAQCGTGGFMPFFFRYPGKVADMVASGEYKAFVALNAKRDIVGGILFYNRTEKIVQCFGPYVFAGDSKEETTGSLLDACVADVVRSKSLGLLSISGLPESLKTRFEQLGSILFLRKDDAPMELYYYFRHLHEDPVCEVWMHGDIENFLRGEYERLVLAREMRAVQTMGETRSGSSIFSAEMRSERSETMLRPLWPGVDLETNVRRHVRFLKQEGILNIFCELDLGVSWHASLIPVLTGNGFRPKILLPFSGRSDLVIFQNHEA